ncbi:MAG: tungstate ABC transporter substrate-binding protein WtpA [Ignavibacteriales bacterium]|nr:tungstate ABC transporter substrate-binding protein WtpA [Ignavibacteriales bacterium]
MNDFGKLYERILIVRLCSPKIKVFDQMNVFSLKKAFFLFLLIYGSVNAQNQNQLIIFHAGSLTVPFEKIINGFKKENPGIEVLKEIAGSRECARKISELKKPCDIFASADYMVIDQLLIPQYADWNLKFATNEMAIVFTDKSRRANEINQKNWFEILLDKNISVGRADPNADPCGYRTILTMKLAEIFYNKKGLAEKLIKKDHEYIRPKEVDLLALLEEGELDYIFLYRSVAEQHGLKFLILPDKINLKRAELENYYKQVSVELNGKKPGEKIYQEGSSMVYGVTIPKNSPNYSLAKKFIHYLMDKKKGLKVIQEFGQPTVIPSVCDAYNKLPDDLKKYALKKK